MGMETSRPRATVIGAGFSGLITAYFLERAGFSVEIHERAGRPGGLLDSVESPYGLVETGANAFLNTPRIESLFRDLGIPQLPSLPTSRARLIFRDGRPRRWPLGPGASARASLFLLRYLFSRDSLRPRAGESVAQWGRRELGSEATEYLLLPALQGIYAGDGERLSASLILAALFRPRGPSPRIRGSISARGGMATVVRSLREQLESRGVRFHFQSEREIERPANHLTVFCGSVRDAVHAFAAKDPELSHLLGKIEVLPIATTTVFYPRHRKIRPGFGCLFPKREGFSSLGVLYNSMIFPGRGDYQSETWISGGAKVAASGDGMTEAGLRAEIQADRKRLHRLDEAPLARQTRIWPGALPHYTTELERLLPEIENLLKQSSRSNLRLVGNYLGGLGLSKIADAAAELAERERRARIVGKELKG